MAISAQISKYDDPQPWRLYDNRQRWGFLAVLFLVATSNYVDRHVLSVLLEPIKQEFHLSDTMLGLLSGFSFALFYAVAGVPVARWADRGNRRTIITLALTVWSVMTLLCGLAQTFWQLVLARVGVGAGEAGAIPPAQSLIADYFPPERRATALAVFTSASTAGYLLGVGAGGYIAANYGWREAFLFAGAPGLLLAVIARLTLAEPRLQLHVNSSSTSAEGTREALRKLWSKVSYSHGLAATLAYFMFAYGGLVFLPSFLIRVLNLPLAEVSVLYGTVAAVGGVVGTLAGGWLADRLSRHDVRWLAWLPAVSFGLTVPIFGCAVAGNHVGSFMVLAFFAFVLLNVGMAPLFAAVHAVCGSARRATAIALVFFFASLFGGGLGPLVTGALSDSLGAVYGVEGLRYALMGVTVFLMASAIFSYLFGRAMPRDLES